MRRLTLWSFAILSESPVAGSPLAEFRKFEEFGICQDLRLGQAVNLSGVGLDWHRPCSSVLVPRDQGPEEEFPMRVARNQAGITLVEIVVILVLLSLLALLAVPAFTNVADVLRAQGAADQVAAALRLARFYAVSHFATYTVELEGTTIEVSCSADCPSDAPEEPETPLIHGATVSEAEITFGPLGTASPASVVTVTSPGAATWEVEVTEAGRIRTCAPACT